MIAAYLRVEDIDERTEWGLDARSDTHWRQGVDLRFA